MRLKVTNTSKTTIGGVRSGESKIIQADQFGVPLEKFWRRRVQDSKIDGIFSVEEVVHAKPTEG